MVEKLEHHGPVRLLEHDFKIQMVVIHMYKGTSVLFYLISINLTIQSWGYLQHISAFEPLRKVVIYSHICNSIKLQMILLIMAGNTLPTILI